MKKTCGRCQVEKPLEQFFADKRTRTGRGSYCKECATKAARAWTLANAERGREGRRAWSAAHPEIVRESNKINYTRHRIARIEYARARRAERGESSDARHSKHLRRSYGIDRPTFDAMLLAQGGLCALCDGDLRDNYGRRPTVDHDHATGEVRGLVHIRCNTALGVVEEIGPERFASYLRRAQMRVV